MSRWSNSPKIVMIGKKSSLKSDHGIMNTTSRTGQDTFESKMILVYIDFSAMVRPYDIFRVSKNVLVLFKIVFWGVFISTQDA